MRYPALGGGGGGGLLLVSCVVVGLMATTWDMMKIDVDVDPGTFVICDVALLNNCLQPMTKYEVRILLWRHNGRYGVSNHQPQDILLNRLFKRRSNNTSKLRVTGLCVRGIHRWPVNSPHKWSVTRNFFHLMTSSCSSLDAWHVYVLEHPIDKLNRQPISAIISMA